MTSAPLTVSHQASGASQIKARKFDTGARGKECTFERAQKLTNY
jgi:hypothetical protein